ncbi:MAG: peptidoglycan-binding domain-containing protein, partial [Candidatus Nomurabacteria bacterium]|nr:peptidoglycan-binding domain-containing protein [Candidatus Nomurabacteria bacterium]
VNFRPTNGGVKINSNGEFEVYAWLGGIYGGWIKFDCNVSATCVRTDWVPRGNRPASVFILGSSYFIKPPKVAEEIKSPTVTPKSLTPVISIPSKNITVSITPLTKPLQIGSNTNDVKTLQTFLSKDKTLYPEALISGYFGQATKKAVQKFQLKYKLAKPGDSAYGYVGPATSKKINDLLKKQ